MREPIEDSYRADAKLPDPARCPKCGATYLKGRWTWEKARAASAHPLQRIMAVDDVADGIRVTTIDAHLASCIARALHEAFHGSVELKYSRDEHLVRAIWRPERR